MNKKLVERLNAWDWHKEPVELVDQSALWIAKKLNVSELEYSPSWYGTQLIKEFNAGRLAKRIRYIAQPFDHCPNLGPMVWARELWDGEKKNCKYLVAFDKKAAYLKATGIYLGCGQYENWRGFKKGVIPPGWYKCEVRGKGFEFNGRYWPSPITDAGITELGTEWYPAEVLKAMDKFNWDYEIKQGFFFKEKARLLQEWGNFLKDLLGELDGSESWHKTARKGVKKIYGSTFGYMRSISYKIDRWSYRPDWVNGIIGESRLRLLCNIERYDLRPCLILTDELFMCVRESPFEINLDRNQYKLSRIYKLEDCIPIWTNTELPLSIASKLRKLEQVQWPTV